MPCTASYKESLVLQLLDRAGNLTIEQVAAGLPELTWCELFHLIDDLSRRGAILLRRRGFEYEVSLAGRHPVPAL